MKKAVIFTMILCLSICGMLNAQDKEKYMLVLNNQAESMNKINLTTGASAQITNNEFGLVPNDIVVYNGKGYIINSNSHNIQIINLADFSIEGTISLPTVESAGANPMHMVFTGFAKAYVTSWVHNKVYIIDVDKKEVTGSIDVGTRPTGILRVDRTVYVANCGYNPATWGYENCSVSIIDAVKDSVTYTFDMPANPQQLAVSPAGKVYTICTGNYSSEFGKIVVIDPFGSPTWTPAVVDTVELGGSPSDIEITSTGLAFMAAGGEWTGSGHGYMYVYNTAADTVLHSVSNPVNIGDGVMNIYIDNETDDVYAACYSADKIQKINPADFSIVQEYQAGQGPGGITVYTSYGVTDPFADEVVSFTPGADCSGYGSEYYPFNIIGPPDRRKSITETNQSNDPRELLSLGTDGEIVVGFTNNVVFNGPGPDFTVFENPFKSLWDGSHFVEAGIVSVSQDGQNWYTFPYDTSLFNVNDPTTFKGLAGVNPTLSGDPTDPSVSGGDSFDLSDIETAVPPAWIKYVKITDLGSIKKEGPWNGDFDLDAVVAINSSLEGLVGIENNSSLPGVYRLEQNYPNPFNPETTIKFEIPKTSNVTLKIYNSLGQIIRTLINKDYSAGFFHVVWDGRNDSGLKVSSGLYIYSIKAGDYSMSRKMVLLK